MLYISFLIISITSLMQAQTYCAGDQINNSDLNTQYEVCYGSGDYETGSTWSLADYDGSQNGGNYHVIFMDMSATWWGTCYSSISSMDAHEAYWAEQNPAVVFIMALQDLNQPYSCEQWGDQGVLGAPLIVEHDGALFDLFHDSWNAFPTYLIIDHNMQVRAKTWSYDSNSNSNSCDGTNATMPGFNGGDTDDFLQYLVDECGPLCDGNPDLDNDGVLTIDDNCPNDPNPSQSDLDQDGVGDECDDCFNMAGDLNQDMLIDVLDIVSLVNIILNVTTEPSICTLSNADFNIDGTVNVQDIILVINTILN